MKLQNIENPNIIADLDFGWSLYDRKKTIVLKQYGVKEYEYNSLSELYKEWKDYKPLLPIEIREGFKQWAEFNNIKKVIYNLSDNDFSWFSSANEKAGDLTIDFGKYFDCLEEGKEYTVKELVDE